MKKLNNKELEKIIGGASGLTVTTVIGAIIVFATGIFDGYKPQCLYKIYKYN